MPKQTLVVPRVRVPLGRMDPELTRVLGDFARTIEQHLIRMTEAIDEQRGDRGTPRFNADVDAGGRRITNLGDPSDTRDAVPAALALTRPSATATYYDAENLPIRNATPAVEVTEVVTLQQLREEIQPASDIINSSFVTINAESALPFARRLAAESGVTTVTDAGAGSTVTVGVATNGIANGKFRQGAATSVVGVTGGSTANVADIAASTDGQVLRRASGALAFGAVDLADGDAVTGTLAAANGGTGGNFTFAAGTYTPTLTGVANLDAQTAYECQYLRVGTVITVSGRVDVDPTAGASTQLGISLPVASNLGATEDCAGVAFASGIAGQGAAIRGDATNNRAEMIWVAVDLTNQPMYFTFSYQVI